MGHFAIHGRSSGLLGRFGPTWLALSVSGLGLVGVGCSKDKPRQTEESTATPASTASANSTAAPDANEAPAEGKPLTLRWADLGTEAMKSGISSVEEQGAEVPAASSPAVAPEPGGLLTFARVAGADGTFCGALRSGPIQCWGAKAALHPGAFVDVAIAADAVCGATAAGGVECFRASAPTGLVKVQRIAGAGQNFCALDRAGQVTCWDGTGAAVLPAPVGLVARYFALGDGFVCAADAEKKLTCWGATEALKLPTPAPVVQDVAAGAHFVCIVDAASKVSCFGAELPFPAGSTSPVAAAYGTACATQADKSVLCRGEVTTEFGSGVVRVSVGAHGVCAVHLGGELDCRGTSDTAELQAPRAPANAGPAKSAKTGSRAEFEAFLAQFSRAQLPLDLTRNGTFTVGDRLSRRHGGFVAGSASDYRAGVQITLPSGATAVTLLELSTGALHLFTYSADGALSKRRTLTQRKREGDPITDTEDGTGQSALKVSTTESRITAEGVVETTTFSGTEVTHYVKKHIDGSRPVARIVCTITEASSADLITKNGDFTRKSAKLGPARSTTDAKGCAEAWPFSG